jgi:phage terminase small subunit
MESPIEEPLADVPRTARKRAKRAPLGLPSAIRKPPEGRLDETLVHDSYRTLTIPEERFCHQYVISFGRAAEAYRMAYAPPKGTTAGQIALAVARLLTDNSINYRIDQIRASSRVTAPNVLAELSAIVFSDPGDLFDDENRLRPMRTMPRNVRAAISSIEVERRHADGRGADGETYDVIKIKWWNKNNAIENMMKHLGLFEIDNMQQAGLLDGLSVDVARKLIERLKSYGAGRGLELPAGNVAGQEGRIPDPAALALRLQSAGIVRPPPKTEGIPPGG